MRGWVAISVTATPAAAPRSIREVLRMIIREPSGLRLRPTMGLDRREPRPCGELHVKYGLACTARFGNGRLGSAAHYCDGLARYHELPQVNGYPFHPSEQDMISAAGIKDQELTIIVSMMLIELVLLRLSRFKRLALLDTQGLELLVALHPRIWWGRDNQPRSGGKGAEYSEFRNPSASGSSLEAVDAEKQDWG